MRGITWAGLLCLALPAVGRAQPPADTVLQYAWYRSGQTAAAVTALDDVAPGQTVALDLYLVQTGGTTPVLQSDDGLFAVGARLTFNSAVVTNVSVTPNAGFDDQDFFTSNLSATATSVTFQAQATDPSADPPPVPFVEATAGVRVASVTFQVATGSVGQSADMTAGVIPDPTSPANTTTTTVTFAGTALDGLGAGFTGGTVINAGAVTVTPVPEPGLVLGVAAVGLGAARGLRRRRAG